MPLKSYRELLVGEQRPKPAAEVTYVAPENEYALTLDRVAALVRARPEMASQTLCYEVERVSLGDGMVLITSACFEPATDDDDQPSFPVPEPRPAETEDPPPPPPSESPS
jgi:hypothetical protein